VVTTSLTGDNQPLYIDGMPMGNDTNGSAGMGVVMEMGFPVLTDEVASISVLKVVLRLFVDLEQLMV
jgi:hypothetical protein